MCACVRAWALCACESTCTRILIGGLHCSHAEGCRLFLIHHADLDSKIRHIKSEMLHRVSTHTRMTDKKKSYPISSPNVWHDLPFSRNTTLERFSYWFNPFTPNHTSVIPPLFSFQSFPSLSSRNLTSNQNVKMQIHFFQLAQLTQTYNWILPINMKAFFILIIRSCISHS